MHKAGEKEMKNSKTAQVITTVIAFLITFVCNFIEDLFILAGALCIITASFMWHIILGWYITGVILLLFGIILAKIPKKPQRR